MCIGAAASGGYVLHLRYIDAIQSVLQHDAAGFARAMCTALRAEAPSCSSTGTVTDTATIPTVSIGTEAVTDDMVDTDVAEADGC